MTRWTTQAIESPRGNSRAAAGNVSVSAAFKAARGRIGRGVSFLVATLLVCLGEAPAYGYGFYQYGSGRNASLNRHDVPGTLWNLAGGDDDNDGTADATDLLFNFGNIGGFNPLAPGLPAFLANAAAVQTAVVGAANAWEPWANVSFGNAVGPSGTGNVQLRFINTVGNTAYTWGYQHPHNDEVTTNLVVNNYAEIVFGPNAPGGVAWNADNFRWTVMHELGHVLGLRDLYSDAPDSDNSGNISAAELATVSPQAEEFVDHPLPPVPDTNVHPDRPPVNANGFTIFGGEPGSRGYSDNVMFQNRLDGLNYAQPSQTGIDNDEISGVTWLWNGPYNQIVTGDLSGAWNGGRRGSTVHHGDQANPLTEWDYRGTIVSAGAGNSFVDIEFPGYQGFTAQSWGPATTWTHIDLGNDIHRFRADTPGWTGNFQLTLNSEFSAERRVRAWVSGGRLDEFVLPISTSGRVFSGGNDWPVVFGPLSNAQQYDYGDAPDSYQTLLASNGPRYQDGSIVRLGARWDTEPDGQPTPLANGDDVNLWGLGGLDDEDGVLFGTSWVDVTITNLTGLAGDELQLRAWWDLNRNGIFDHGSELFIDDDVSDVLASLGSTVKHYDLAFDPRSYYSRFRLTWATAGHLGDLGDITPFGEFVDVVTGFSVGEVEDFVVPTPEPSTCLPAVFALSTLGLLAGRRRKQGIANATVRLAKPQAAPNI